MYLELSILFLPIHKLLFHHDNHFRRIWLSSTNKSAHQSRLQGQLQSLQSDLLHRGLPSGCRRFVPVLLSSALERLECINSSRHNILEFLSDIQPTLRHLVFKSHIVNKSLNSRL